MLPYAAPSYRGASAFFIAASDAPPILKNRADQVLPGAADDVAIQSAIGTYNHVVLSNGTVNPTSTITVTANQSLFGQGVGQTTIQTSTDMVIIQCGNRQSDNIMRNWMEVGWFTLTQNNGTQTHANLLIDGGGRGTTLKRISSNGGNYGFELMDLDRCNFEHLQGNNPKTAAFFCEVGKENTYGTVKFDTCDAVLGGTNNTYGWLFGKNADQGSPNSPDRMTFENCLFFMSTGLTGCVGLYLKDTSITSGNFIGCLFEQNLRHVRWDTGGSSLRFEGCTFLDSNNACTDIFYMNQSGTVTVADCRLQQATNAFNAVSSSPSVTLEGHNNNQGNITNVWTGTFGNRQGSDTVFGGDTNMVSGLDNQRYDSVFANHVRGNPIQLKPSSDGNDRIQLQNSSGSILGQVDTTNGLFGMGITPSGSGFMQTKAGAQTTNIAKIGGVIFDHIADAGNTHTDGATFDDLYSDSLAASIFNTNGDKIVADYSGIFVGSTSTKEIKVLFAGSTILDSTALAITTAESWDIDIILIRESSTVVRVVTRFISTTAALAGVNTEITYTRLTGLTLTNANILKIQAVSGSAGAAANDIVAKLGTIAFYPSA